MRTIRIMLLFVCVLLISATALPASVKTSSGGVIEGDIQGIIAGKIRRGDDIIFVIFKGEDIESIDERGVTARKAAWLFVQPVPGIQMPPDTHILQDMARSDRQIWYDRHSMDGPIPGGKPAAFPLIGELLLGRDGADSDLLPRIRIKTTKGETILKLADVVSFVDAKK
jgi:hypothetical protein